MLLFIGNDTISAGMPGVEWDECGGKGMMDSGGREGKAGDAQSRKDRIHRACGSASVTHDVIQQAFASRVSHNHSSPD